MARISSKDGTAIAFERAGSGPPLVIVTGSLAHRNLYGVAKAITAPALVMDGEKSMRFMRPTADRVASLIPNAQRKTLKGQTQQAEGDAVAPVLIEFFGKRS